MNTEIPIVNAQEAFDLLEKGEAVMIDVREEDEYEVAHIANTPLYPLSSFDEAEFIEKFGTDKSIILQCRSGGRSGRALEVLKGYGYKGQLFNLAGGIISWTEEFQLPVIVSNN